MSGATRSSSGCATRSGDGVRPCRGVGRCLLGRLAAAGAAGAAGAVEVAARSSALPSDRLRPLAGSKMCSFRASTHSSASEPSVTREAGSSRATMVSPVLPVSARPESLASSSSSATFAPFPSSWVKKTNLSEPSDSITSMVALNLSPFGVGPATPARRPRSAPAGCPRSRPGLARGLNRLPVPGAQRHVPQRGAQLAILQGAAHEVHRGRADEARHEQVGWVVVQLLRCPPAGSAQGA